VARIRALAAAPSDPDEIHVIQFPSEQSFAAYKADPRLAQLSGLKQQVIAKMEVYVTSEFYDYG